MSGDEDASFHNRIGETSANRHGTKATIIKYKNAKNIIVKCDNGYIKNMAYKEFKLGIFKTPYCLSVYNVGYLGIGKYSTKNKKAYQSWIGMIKRVHGYDKHSHCYEDCLICKEWYCFQNFAEWYENNTYTSPESLSLDKDILFYNNKIYSCNTCVLVPNSINSLFCCSHNHNKTTPSGINKWGNYYYAIVSDKKNNATFKYKGKTLDEAWEWYVNKKNIIIKERADKFKNIMPEYIYNAICSYDIRRRYDETKTI